MISPKIAGQSKSEDEYCHFCEHLKLIDMLHEGLILLNADDLRISYMNEMARSMYGYGAKEPLNLCLADIACSPEGEIIDELIRLRTRERRKFIHTAMHRRKNGQMLNVEVNVQYMRLHGSDTYVVLVRDMTFDLLIKADVMRAEKIQRQLLPGNIDSDRLLMNTIYKPHSHISGDLYGYSWQEDGTKLFGYLMDVMGHGVATALQAATVRVLFEQVAPADMPLYDKMVWLNSNTLPYFVEDSFAAAICFEIDFSDGSLTCCSGGINQFVLCMDNHTEVIMLPGSFLGLNLEADFEIFRINFKRGDSFFFFSDGLSDLLSFQHDLYCFENIYKELIRLAECDNCRDDASALCFFIK